MKLAFLILLSVFVIFLHGQNTANATGDRLLKYTGKYETNGFVVQVAIYNDSLVLVVPGAPLQVLIPVMPGRFRSEAYDNAFFVFIETAGKVDRMISESPGNTIELIKISDLADPVNAGDALLTRKKTTRHFTFLYSEKDSVSVDQISNRLEKSYDKILRDFKMKTMPVTTVRIYPSLKHFHEGINFPDAPPNVVATAFGKNDIRMPSPGSVSAEDSLNLLQNITHEFVHCVHLNIDYAPNNPRWLWEGIAMFEADWFIDPRGLEVIRNKTFPPFAELNNGLEYELGYVIIEAIKDIWGFDTVIDLIKRRGDVKHVLNLEQKDFEERIYKYIDNKYIQR